MKSLFVLLAVFVCLIQVAAERVSVFPQLLNPKYLMVDDGRLYVSDYPYVYIYSMTDFKLIKKIGGVGRGPSEFYVQQENMNLKLRGLVISKFHDFFAVCSEGRVSLFDSSGNFLKFVQPPYNINGKYFLLKDKFLCLMPQKGKLSVLISGMGFRERKEVFHSIAVQNTK